MRVKRLARGERDHFDAPKAASHIGLRQDLVNVGGEVGLLFCDDELAAQ